MMDITLIPDIKKLNHRLGETYELDGSFASLWAIEIMLRLIRKRPEWQTLFPWIPDYILSILERAYREMGYDVFSNNGTLTIPELDAKFCIYNDYKFLVNPSQSVSVFSQFEWLSAPFIGLGACPWYATSVLFNQSTHKAHNERALNWLCLEHFNSELDQDPELKKLGYQILEALLWPTLSHPNNQNAKNNFDQIQTLFESNVSLELFLKVTLKLLTSQDSFLSVLAGGVCFRINIAPTSPLEARCLKRSIQYFKPLPVCYTGDSPDRILEVIKFLSVNNETPLQGITNQAYLTFVNFLNQAHYDKALDLIKSLVDLHPANPLYRRSRGKLFENIGKDQLALDDYNRALVLKQDYWQALINRGSFYAKRKKFESAEMDYLTAFNLRQDCDMTRNNLLSLYFFSLQSQAQSKTR